MGNGVRTASELGTRESEGIPNGTTAIKHLLTDLCSRLMLVSLKCIYAWELS